MKMPCDNIKTTSEIENVDWSTGTGSGHHYANVRFGSGSSQASQSSGDICRICHCESDPQNPLLTPCYCSGSLKYVHQTCLQQWLTASETNSCELCKFPFIMHTKIKPFNEWRSLDISGIERRRLCCSVLFHCAAALCVIWSLCVLIERAADDVMRGLIDWPFWTKLAVVTVGLTGGLVFMYIQCKAYLHLCHRWKARNRILLIQNAPEKIHPLSPPSPVANHRSRHSGSHEPIRVSVGGVAGGMEIGNNAAASSNAFNFTNSGGGLCGSRSTDVDGAAALHLLPSSPHHMLQQGDLDIDALTTHSSNDMDHHHHHHHHHHQQSYHFPQQQQVGQVAVSANIECSQSQHNYERDWALDDVVSQISSFRPCPQGSGSMTPFHDSIHNVLENSESSSRISVNDVCSGSRQDLSTGCVSTDTGREHCLQLSSYSGSEHKAPSIGSGVSTAVANGLGGFAYKPHTKRYSNSSIFLENRDILTDSVDLNLEPSQSDFPKISYRHSSILSPTEGGTEQLEQFLSRDSRRYSDTKLLDSADATTAPMTPTATDLLSGNMDSATRDRLRQMFKTQPMTLASATTAKTATTAASPDTVIDVDAPQLHKPANVYSNPTALPVDSANGAKAATACGGVTSTSSSSSVQQSDKTRLFFKSLPNLSSSCESLIKK